MNNFALNPGSMGQSPGKKQKTVGCGSNHWYHSGVGEFTTHFRTYFSGWIESDVHWGYDLALDFDPWPVGWAAFVS